MENLNKVIRPLILLIGYSGSGKTTLANTMSKTFGMTQVESYTDRPRRSPNETGHTFVTKEEFNKLRPDMAAYNVFDGCQYGATYQQLDKADIYVVDIPGYWDLMRNYHNRPFLTFILDADPMLCQKRMKARGDSDEKIRERLTHDMSAFAGIYDVPAVRLNAALSVNKLLACVIRVVLQYVVYNNI